MWRHLLILIPTVLGLGFASSSAFAKAGAFTGTVNVSGNTSTEDWQAYGDSIIAGYCGIACQTDSYLVYYAELAGPELNADINYDSDGVSGNTTSQIEDQMSTSELSSADAVIWSAGGNDFLDARSDYRSNCNLTQLEDALGIDRSTGLPQVPHTGWVADWDSLLDRVSNNVSSTARVTTMNVYYPGVSVDQGNFCGSDSHFDTFLPLLLAAGDYMCTTAEAEGYGCADAIDAMNCDFGGVTDCPSTYAEWVSLGGDAFTGNFGDALSLGKLQSDNTHPNATGHQDIADAHDALGY